MNNALSDTLRRLSEVKKYILDISGRMKPAFIAAAAGLSSLLWPAAASAKAPEDYARSSVLAEGRWAKISVSTTGMQYLSAARLRQLGFSDPSKVNVYGYGGRLISDLLDDRQIDDLPILPVVRTGGGILFYGVSSLRPVYEGGTLTHVSDPYSDDSFYFLSDREAASPTPATAEAQAPAGVSLINSFTRLLVHERDLAPAGDTGRLLLGEDFRSATTQTFPFTLTDRVEGTGATVSVAFAAKTTGGSSTVTVSAGNRNVAQGSIPACTGEAFIARTVIPAACTPESENLSVGIQYRAGGTLFRAGLDYIEVRYQQALRLRNGQLAFSLTPIYGTSTLEIAIQGCSESTQVWDVTDPARPVSLSYRLEGSEAQLSLPSEYREYVAFNPEATALVPASAGTIANQDIHALDTPDLLIISPSEYSAAAERIAAYHREHDSMRVHVLTPAQLYNEFSSGVKDLSAFRKAMKMWYDRGTDADGHTLRYCLLMGRPAVNCKAATAQADGMTYPVMPIWQSPEGFAQTSSYSSDNYIGMLTDCTSGFNMATQQVNVAVGRFPVKSVAEANAAADKFEAYMTRPSYGNWRNRIVLIADDDDSNAHLNDSEDIYSTLSKTGIGPNFKYDRIYLDSYPLEYTGSGAEYPQARARFYSLLDQGIMYVSYMGHANPTAWGHEKLMTWTDITGLDNRNLPFITAGTCDFARWDDGTVCGAENMWLNPSGGAIGFISASRKVWISQNGNLMRSMARQTFTPGPDGLPKRVGDFYVDGLNGLSNDDNRHRYLIIGDPAMRLPFHSYSLRVDEIDGKPVDPADMPQVKARGRFTVKGTVIAPDGNPDPTFNGFAQLILMDAEVVVSTFGNGEHGIPTEYNDRKTQLFAGKTAVTDGSFTFTVNMPSEIDNNWSPALMSLYACSDSGTEANGSFTDFYVYGYDYDAEEDTDGPLIEKLTLNNDSFSDGDVTHDTPLVLATLSDPSGINLSEAGIGHKLTITLDSGKIYDDLAAAYTPDINDPTRGDLAFVLPSLEPGRHSLTLTAWDNANNSSTASISFQVAANRSPTLYDVTTNANPATSSVTFILTHDMPQKTLASTVEVFDLSGMKIWSGTSNASAGLDSDVRLTWDLTDAGGRRVPRGIYVYRATVTTPEGTSATKSKKLAVTAP